MTIILYLFIVNIITLWYLAGLYLFFTGLLLFLDDIDILIGFLWLIDLGVGLIFFIFILHFSIFLYQKPYFNILIKTYFFLFLLGLFFFYFFFIYIFPIEFNFNWILKKNWFFFLNWYNFYNLLFCYNFSDLNILREIYFFNNSFEFFLINYILFYGIIGTILFTFLIKNYSFYLIYYQLNYLNYLNESNINFFIRNQNFLKQQHTSTGVRNWLKKKN